MSSPSLDAGAVMPLSAKQSGYRLLPTVILSAGALCMVGAIVQLSNYGVIFPGIQEATYNLHRSLQAISKHKDIFPLDNSDIIGSVLVFFGLIISASGGIGGGGILVPILILVFAFHPKHAIALSNFTILGSAITNTALNFPKRHPSADRPLVDWDLILVMEPLTAAGAIVGAYMSKVLPDWFLALMLVVLLGVTAHRTLNKGISQYKKETEEHAKRAKNSAMQSALDDNEKEIEMEEASPLLDEVAAAENVPDTPEALELKELLEKEKETPIDKFLFLVMMFVVVIALNLLKGGGASYASPLGIVCGTRGYWIISFVNIAWLFGLSLYARTFLIKAWKTKRRIGYKYLDGDVEWSERNTLVYPLLCVFAGMCAGLFGVGGGIVKGPLMLEMGVHPMVAAATSAVMILFTTMSATTTFIAFGTLTFDYAGYLFCLGLVATTIGQLIVGHLVKKYERVSLISLSIGAVVGLSTLLMGFEAIYSLVTEESQESGTVCN